MIASACGAQADDPLQDSTTATTTSIAPASSTTTASPSTTTSTTTTSEPQAADGPLVFDFTLVKGIDDPVIPDGSGEDWDATYAFAPNVVYDGSTFHMFYSGWATDSSIAIGYASSSDGVNYTEHPDNPVATLLDDDPDTEAGRAVTRIREDGTWEMFIGEWVDAKTQGDKIWYATAPQPTGPWTVDPSPIHTGEVGTWESRLVPQSVTPDGQILYYDGARLSDLRIGALFRQDDGTWTPYDDPTTEEPTDPILSVNPEANSWDAGNVASALPIVTESGYEMLYAGFWKGKSSKERWAWLGYATSNDGIEWERYEANPAVELTNENGWLWLSAVKVDDTYFVYYAIGAGSDGIGLITGSIAER